MQNFRISDWHSYPDYNLHIAMRQTYIPLKYHFKICVSPFGTITRKKNYPILFILFLSYPILY